MGESPLSIAVVGVNYWGKNYLRVLNELPQCELTWACDLDAELLGYSTYRYPRLKTSSDLNVLLQDQKLSAVVISTPAATHFEIAHQCLEAGKHLLIEKPMALSENEATQLNQLAGEKSLTLMVAHTFLYNPAVRAVKEILDRGDIGEIYYVKTTRCHLGLIRKDVNVVWDLATHDLSILQYLLGNSPKVLQASGKSFFRPHHEDVVFVTLDYPGNVLVEMTVSWIDTHKQRLIEIVGSRGRVIFDDLNPLEPVRIFERGIAIDNSANSFGEFQYLLRDGAIISPRVKMVEPLKLQCEHFLESIKFKTVPLTSGTSAISIIQTLEQIQQKLLR